jgi:hypothetical protein
LKRYTIFRAAVVPFSPAERQFNALVLTVTLVSIGVAGLRVQRIAKQGRIEALAEVGPLQFIKPRCNAERETSALRVASR